MQLPLEHFDMIVVSGLEDVPEVVEEENEESQVEQEGNEEAQ